MDLEKLYDTLNPSQKEAVFHEGNQPLLVLAGAGSGKTRVITLRMAYLIDNLEFKGSSIIGFTFTNKAATEMKERVSHWLQSKETPSIKTFHSFGSWFLRLYSPLVGINERFSIWDLSDVIAALKNLNLSDLLENKSIFETISWRKLAFALIKSKEVIKETGKDYRYIPHFEKILKRYENYRKSSNAFDFADLIRVPIEILKSHPEVKRRIHEKFKAVFVDEYQDTNHLQFLLLKELVHKSTLLCAVGDEDQCIYGFRGARLENILQFQDQFKRTKVIRLEENYRSSGHIIQTTSHLISHNNKRLGKVLFTKNPQGEKVSIYCHETSESEARFWAQKFKEDLSTTESTKAIIYRINAHSLSYEKALRDFKVPYKVIGSLRFYEREEIKDALSYLKCIDNVYDKVAFLRIINKPTRGLGKKAMEILLSELEKGSGVWETLKRSKSLFSSSTSQKIENLLTCISSFQEDIYKLAKESSENLSAAITKLFWNLGLFEYYKKLDQKELSERLSNLEEFVASAIDYEASEEDLRDFIESTELAPEREESEGESRKPIFLLTAHSSKGLEFDEVVVSGLEEGIFPIFHQDDDFSNLENHIEEERRLFYVAMTRARQILSLSFCRLRVSRGRRYTVGPSLFLKELPKENYRMFKTSDPQVKKNFRQYRQVQFSSSSYQEGDLILHNYWGEGEVIRVWQKQGEVYLRVLFEGSQEKVIMPEYDKITKI